MHKTKLEALRIWLIQKERLIVAHSVGVDSAFLAAVAHESLGERAVMGVRVTPERLGRASALAGEISVRLSDLGCRYVTLDLGGFRSESLNEMLPASELRIRS